MSDSNSDRKTVVPTGAEIEANIFNQPASRIEGMPHLEPPDAQQSRARRDAAQLVLAQTGHANGFFDKDGEMPMTPIGGAPPPHESPDKWRDFLEGPPKDVLREALQKATEPQPASILEFDPIVDPAYPSQRPTVPLPPKASSPLNEAEKRDILFAITRIYMEMALDNITLAMFTQEDQQSIIVNPVAAALCMRNIQQPWLKNEQILHLLENVSLEDTMDILRRLERATHVSAFFQKNLVVIWTDAFQRLANR